MAQERGLTLRFGPQRGEWLIEADEDAERLLAKELAKGGEAASKISRISSARGHKAASQRALSLVKRAQDGQSGQTVDSKDKLTDGEQLDRVAEILAADPGRASLPLRGFGRDQLREALESIKPIREATTHVSSHAVLALPRQ